MNLAGFQGYLQTDGYKAYEQLIDKKPKTRQGNGNSEPRITHLACWVHARRNFDQAHNNKVRSAGLTPQARKELRLDLRHYRVYKVWNLFWA